MKSEWSQFIEYYLISNDHITAYQKAYPNSSRQTAATKGKALLLKPMIREKIVPLRKQKVEIISAVRNEAIATESAKGTIADELEIDKFLTAMMRGEVELEKVFINKAGVPFKLKVKPDHADTLSAADKLNRRFGRYVADVKNPKDPQAIPILLKTEEELRAYLAGRINLLNE